MKDNCRKPDLEAERQAYALFYESRAKNDEEDNGARLRNDEIPKSSTELRRFVSPLGAKCGPLSAQQTSARLHYEHILNGDVEEDELEQVKEWEANSLKDLAERRRISRKSSSKRGKKPDDESISRVSIHGKRNR